MYSLLSLILGITLLGVVAALFFAFRKKMNTLLGWFQILFGISFFSCIALMIYYTHYFLGESKSLQKLYFGLFWLSVLLLIAIVVLRLLKYYKKNKH